MRAVGEAQIGIQATYAASLDAQAVGLLAVDVALIGVLATVRVSTVALPPHWALALMPLGISAVRATLAATVVGAPGVDATGRQRAEDQIAVDKDAEIGQATARDGLALVPTKFLKLLHLD